MKNTAKKAFLRAFYILAFAAAIIILAGGAFYFAYKGRIYPHTYAAGIDFGGKTNAQAAQMLNDKQTNMPATLNVKVVSDTAAAQNGDITLASFSPAFKNTQAADAMYAVGRQGKLLNKITAAFRSMFSKNKINLEVSIDPKNLQDGYTVLQDRFGLHPVQNAAYVLDENGQPFVESEHSGFGFSVNDLNNELVSKLSTFNTSVQLTAKTLQPEVKVSDLAENLSVAAKILTRVPLNLTAGAQKSVIDKNIALSFLGGSSAQAGDKAIFDEDVIKKFLADIAAKTDTDAHDVSIEKVGDSWQVQGDISNGQKLQIDNSVQLIEDKLLATDTKPNTSVTLPIDTVTAKVQGDAAVQLGIKELIGIGETDFVNSPANRIHNIVTGAKAFNNALIPPNTEFSALKTLGPVDKNSGYLPELVIKEDSTVPEYGGGLCQVSTTLFRAALNAGLKITQRQNHSYRVPYYEPPIGLDATIYIPGPDFRFMNDTPGYILVATKVVNTHIAFYLFGTKDGRSSTISTPVVTNIVAPPAPKYTLTASLAPGVTKRVDTQHYGANAVVHYTVTRNGQVINSQTFNSHYQAWQAKYLVGAPVGWVPGTAADGTPLNPSATPTPAPTGVPAY